VSRIHLADVLLLAVLIALTGCGNSFNGPGDSVPDVAQQAHDQAHDVDAFNGNHQSAISIVDVTDDSGITFTYENGEDSGEFALIESLGGGVGLLDFDMDGDLDVMLTGGGTFTSRPGLAGAPSALYRHTGTLQFEDVSQLAEVSEPGVYSHGVAVSDVDNDGFCDVLITGYGGLRLLKNMGDGTFEDQTADHELNDSSWSTSAAFADFNGDSNVDLYVVHYLNWSLENNPKCFETDGVRDVCPPRKFDPLPDTIFISRGDGTYREASTEWGLRDDGKGLGVVVGDLDFDGRPDVYVGNDSVPNFLYRNLGDRFEDAGLISGASMGEYGTADGSMGVDIGDFDNDGHPDLWASNYESESFALYRNDGKGFFQPVSSALGLSAVGALYVGWGTSFMDLDHDGDLDVFVSNGHVIRNPSIAELRQQPLVFENIAGERYVNVASQTGQYTSSPHMGRGLATGDLDNDGDVDLVVSHTNEPVAVLENRSKTNYHWIGFRLIGTSSSRIPVGTRIHLQTSDGRVQVRQLKAGSSFASSCDTQVIMGLNTADGVQRVSIVWPSGSETIVNQIEVDQFHTMIEPAGRVLPQ
jgi:enediyne biosynthesis protein E4